MSDSTLNRFLAEGTNAQRLAFTPSVPTPSSGPTPCYIWFETDTGNTYAWNVGGSTWTQINTSSSNIAQTITPQGRLTLVTGTPVLTSAQTAKATVYYTPYIGSIVPIWSGSAWTTVTLAEITLALNATDNVSGSLYDIFVYNNSGTLTLGTGPAWTSSTARGTGAGTTELQQLNGIWTNKNAITLHAGGSSLGSKAANICTYLGTLYATANGQTGMAIGQGTASGGGNNFLALWNAYNRVKTLACSLDTTSSWTYATTTFRAANNSNSNRITFVDGLAQSFIDASYQVFISGGTQCLIGVGIDSTTANTNAWGSNTDTISNASSSPLLGLHYVQAVEWSSGTTTFIGNGGMALINRLEM